MNFHTSHRAVVGVDRGEAQHHAARAHQRLMAAADELVERFVRIGRESRSRTSRDACRGRSVAQRVHDARQDTTVEAADHVEIAGLALPGQRAGGDAPLDAVLRARQEGVHDYRTHLRMITVVPLPTCDRMVKSSIRRRAPGRPRPKPLPVE